MRRVVIVAPDFSPSSLPPALRARFFANHLPSFGWEPIVLTTDPRYYNWPVDPTNEALVREGTQVVRTAAWNPESARKAGIGCIGMRSLWHHWSELKRLCVKEKPDLIFIPVPPFVPMVLGRWAYDRFRIPYVVDYIDPWVSDHYRGVPRSRRPRNWWMADLLSKTVEPYALRKVADIVGVSRGTTMGVIERYGWMTDRQGAEIPYGGDPGDFEYLRRHPQEQNIFRKEDGLFHISSVGRGGADLEQALRAVFDALRNGLKTCPQLFERVRLHFVGTSYGGGQYQVLPLAEEYGLQANVTEEPRRVSYLTALQVLLDSDALLAVGSNARHYTASKIFPYILSRKPLLAVFHEMSSVVEIVRGSHAGTVVTFQDTTPKAQLNGEVESALRELISGGREPDTNWTSFREYTTEAMSARLAEVFDAAAGPNGAGH